MMEAGRKSNPLYLLGAPDPEMALIERLLADAGVLYAHARDQDGRRVSPSTAYQAAAPDHDGPVVLVECGLADPTAAHVVAVVDHHRPGDPGYGCPPAEFLEASSIGQVLSLLARAGVIAADPQSCGAWADPSPSSLVGRYTHDVYTRGGERWAIFAWGGDEVGTWRVPDELVLAAAADHCLAAAYAGECPGVDPDALLAWRVRTRAEFQGRTELDVEADVRRAREVLAAAPRIVLGGVPVADLRDAGHVPELPEAACRDGVPFVAQADRDGRRKVVLQAAPAPAVEAFLADELELGLDGLYGDPARGYAGGYLAA